MILTILNLWIELKKIIWWYENSYRIYKITAVFADYNYFCVGDLKFYKYLTTSLEFLIFQ